jgi:hypothetical protein
MSNITYSLDQSSYGDNISLGVWQNKNNIKYYIGQFIQENDIYYYKPIKHLVEIKLDV